MTKVKKFVGAGIVLAGMTVAGCGDTINNYGCGCDEPTTPTAPTEPTTPGVIDIWGNSSDSIAQSSSDVTVIKASSSSVRGASSSSERGASSSSEKVSSSSVECDECGRPNNGPGAVDLGI